MKNKNQRDYTFESLHRERQYGLYWYSWLWHFLRPWLIGVCALIIVFGSLSFAWGKFSQEYVDPIDPADTAQTTFVVKSGDSLTRVASNLQAQNLIRNRSVFKYYADFMGFGQKIQQGEYTLSRSMTIQQMVQRLTTGDGKPMVRRITIIPGWTIEDIAAYFVKEGVLADSADFLRMAGAGTEYAAYYYIADVLSGGTASLRKYALEGYLAANTYELFMNATADEIIRKLLSQTEALYREGYHERAQALGMTMDEVLTLASLIEKEAKTADFKRVSGIFHNRLNQNMTLGSDVTIKYVLGTKRMVLTREDLNISSPYNTYQHRGLPVGPICAPSPASVEAALFPDEVFMQQGFLYFCSKDPDTGELHFSKTLAEHEQAVAVYGPLWAAFDQRSNAQ